MPLGVDSNCGDKAGDGQEEVAVARVLVGSS